MSAVFNSIGCVWPPAARWALALHRRFPEIFAEGHPPAMNLYITPPNRSQVFALHNDNQGLWPTQTPASPCHATATATALSLCRRGAVAALRAVSTKVVGRFGVT